jgi:hypothetical protein
MCVHRNQLSGLVNLDSIQANSDGTQGPGSEPKTAFEEHSSFHGLDGFSRGVQAVRIWT